MGPLRIVLGFVGAPVAVPIFLALLFGDLDVLITSTFLAYTITVLLGAPAYVIMRRQHWISWWSCPIAGFLIGALPTLLFLFAGAEPFSLIGTFVGAGTIGAVSALIFWIIAFANFRASNVA